MSPWRQLRWRIVAAHMLVVLVGVALILLMALFITQVFTPRRVAEFTQRIEALTHELLERALAERRVDFVSIATPNFTHFEIAKAVAEA